MKTTIPFDGFYQSLHDLELDEALRQMFEGRDDIINEAHNRCQWGLVHASYAKAYAEALADEFDIELTFDKIISPKEYNFETDRIVCDIAVTEVYLLREMTSEHPFRTLARERFTSRPGFISFYSPNVDDWGPIESWDQNQVGTLLEAHINEQRDGDDLVEVELMESARCNGRIEEWITSAIPLSDYAELYSAYEYSE